MKLYMKQLLSISVVLLLCSAWAIAQTPNASILTISVGDNVGSATYVMVFGSHTKATWGMGGQKDSLDPVYIEKESPPLPPGLGVVWRPGRSGVSWGVGFLKYDIKDWTSDTRVDTFRVYFANASATGADITLSWPDAATLGQHCTAATIKIGSDVIDMFSQTSFTVAAAGDNGIAQAYIYKTGATLVETIGTAVKQEKTIIPDEFRLYHNYPNPFNPTTTITFDIQKASEVEVAIYNILGQKVTTLVSQELSPGTYSTVWDATSSQNLTVSSGVYYVRMIARDRGVEQYSALHKLLFVK
jgi:FlgD Ig-like domain